jgi:hypothetical protein
MGAIAGDHRKRERLESLLCVLIVALLIVVPMGISSVLRLAAWRKATNAHPASGWYLYVLNGIVLALGLWLLLALIETT